MASGLTHILLTKKLQNELPEGELKDILAFASDSLQVGAIAPDIPYASTVDDDIFHSQALLADNFHYKKTNQIPLKSLVLLKDLRNKVDDKLHYHMFSFFLGYISHVFADGIIHPFVRDKVGNYQGNESAHRGLEMNLDVILLRELTRKSGANLELNCTNIHDELLNFAELEGADVIASKYGQLIYEVYGTEFSSEQIMGWIKGLHRLFELAEGDYPSFFRQLKGSNALLYKNYNEINLDEVLLLQKPKDRDQNFLKVDSIHFIDDCLSQFYKKYIEVIQKAYDFVYSNGPSLDEISIPMIDLDTGRLVENNSLDEIPVLWNN